MKLHFWQARCLPRSASKPVRLPSIRRNLAANFFSLGIVIASGIIAVPLYVHALGLEAYGLIGFYALLSSAFQVFDFGLSATFARECARYRGGAADDIHLRRLFNTFQIIFFAAAAAGILTIVIAANTIATTWLKVEQLPPKLVAIAIMLAGVTASLQWICNLYRGVFVGFERQVQLGVLSSVTAIARSFGVLIVLQAFGPTVVNFFGYQLGLAAAELTILWGLSRGLIPQCKGGGGNAADWKRLRRVARFSTAIAFVTLCWAVMSQGDRLILSRFLSLSDYGVFTLAVTAVSALITLNGPMGQALLPRLTVLNYEADAASAIQLYRHATQLACVLAVPAALMFAWFAEPIISIWTGAPRVAERAAPILTAYALGAGALPLSAFPYYLQYSRGALRLHVIGQAALVSLFIPGIFWAAPRYGAVGVGAVWSGLNLALFLLWTPVVHGRLAPGLHWRWMLQDVLPTALTATALTGIMHLTLKLPDNRLLAAAELAGISATALISGALASSSIRLWIGRANAQLAGRLAAR